LDKPVIARIALISTLFAGRVIAQDITQGPAGGQSGDILTVAQANRSLSMFVAAIHASGLAKILQDEGPLTVFALSNRAFANLAKEDLETLLTNRAAMRVLLAHYVAYGSIPQHDTANLLSARTLLGVKLRAVVRGDVSYVNGAKLSQRGIRCTNGTIHVLNVFDPGLIRDAVALSPASPKKQ
jgi:uncharacterized surface protein with fasciclin (FAS1) repeats